ncbi:MAG TPA: 16S rRNA (guanine(527)-N(7))-methyltransferase RsmG [Solirubrobacterales bacterium]|nr:16S rRNA (guanine(527)-N(7))-methyltransferase RsmG [Solirubrobacterales bacterium]
MYFKRLQAIAAGPERDHWADLAAGIAALGAPVDPGFAARGRVFLDELDRWNRVFRLTGYPTEAARVRHLLLDSLLFLAVLPAASSPILDLGSGAGVPGLVLKLARPEWAVHLVEANRRRANFLRQAARRLELAAVTVHEARAESLPIREDLTRAFGAVTVRAVAAPDAAVALARPFVRPGGRLVIALGPGRRPRVGTVRRVALSVPGAGLRIERTFLILAADDSAGAESGVPRETPRGAWPES